jgi:hypothetical protein
MTCGLAMERMYNFLMTNFEQVNRDDDKRENQNIQSVVIPTVESDEDTEI